VSNREGTTEVALAGTRVAWVRTGGGNTLETILITATLARPAPIWLAQAASDEAGAGSSAGHLAGDGALLAYTIEEHCDPDGAVNGRPEDQCAPNRKPYAVVSATVWRIGGRGRCPRNPGCSAVATAHGELSVLAVDGGRIAAKTDDGIRLLTDAGNVLRDLPVKASAAALSGTHLAVRTADAIEVYDADSGQLTSRFPVPSGARLEDLEGDVLVTASARTVTLRRLRDGRTTTIETDGTARAQLEPPGLFVAGTRRVTFTPMQDVQGRLGG
jgi:hypothetical protein